jgi:hypothetical protein
MPELLEFQGILTRNLAGAREDYLFNESWSGRGLSSTKCFHGPFILVYPSNGMDRSCEATIYPVLDKPHTTGAFQDRRKIEALLRPA